MSRARRGAGALRPVYSATKRLTFVRRVRAHTRIQRRRSRSFIQSVGPRFARNASAPWQCASPGRALAAYQVSYPSAAAAASYRTQCGLTLRSAATPHGKPLGRRGSLAYAAPRRPSALPSGSRLAQTLGRTAKSVSKRHALAAECQPSLVCRSHRLASCPQLALAAHGAARAQCARSAPAHAPHPWRRTSCRQTRAASPGSQGLRFHKISQSRRAARATRPHV